MSYGCRPRSLRRRRSNSRRERGSATVLVTAAVAVLLVLTWGGLTLTAVVSAMHRSRAAADLAALAGASSWAQGASPASACARSADLARRNGGVLTDCSANALGTVIVTTTVPVRVPLLGSGGGAVARARAGPSDP
ncbi:Rv3654c family TadE-like protein [Knoellia koreensis]|uniref:Pilus assembly protein TadE n=1 Tax=Knoellia koreensis TaxID=2730921 RepID=A0A849HKA9_9MICO|nr:Rv3654c family TadE-like protein [Knoellia sp. DB2414S]NNM47103.1 pilus assembly protein TadE [Knoellia sp. DB2414S]